MFSIFLFVEKELIKHFRSDEAVIRDSFEKVVNKISKLELHTICCESHRQALVSELIYDYVVIRYRFEAKAIKNKEIEAIKSLRPKNRKLSKLAKSDKSKTAKVKKSPVVKKSTTKVPSKTKTNKAPKKAAK